MGPLSGNREEDLSNVDAVDADDSEFDDPFEEDHLLERRSRRRALSEADCLTELPNWWVGPVLPAVATSPQRTPKPPRPHPFIYQASSDADSDDGPEFITIDAIDLLRYTLDYVAVELGGSFVMVTPWYHEVFLEDGIGRIRQQCWCGTEFTLDIGQGMPSGCRPSHVSPMYEYPCERCGRPFLDDTGRYGADMFCSNRCRRARDGVSLAALRAIYDDKCDVCGALVDGETATMYVLEPLELWPNDIRLRRLVHRECLGDRIEEAGLDAIGKLPLIEVPEEVFQQFHGGLGQFISSMNARDYAAAAEWLKMALRVAEIALPAVLERGWSVPKFEAQAVALAALIDDPELDPLIRRVNDSGVMKGSLAPEGVTEMRAVMSGIESALTQSSSLKLHELRSQSQARDGRVFRRALDYLVKANRVAAEAFAGYRLGSGVAAPDAAPDDTSAPTMSAKSAPTTSAKSAIAEAEKYLNSREGRAVLLPHTREMSPTRERALAAPLPSGLLPHEILMLDYASGYRTDRADFHGCWKYDYAIGDPAGILRSLAERGFLEVGSLADVVKRDTIQILTKHLTANGVRPVGRKADLVAQVTALPEGVLAQAYAHRYYARTTTGQAALEEAPWIPFIHRHPMGGPTIWSLTTLMQQQPGRSWHDVLAASLEATTADNRRDRDFGLVRNMRLYLATFFAYLGRPIDELGMLLEVSFYDLSGLDNDWLPKSLWTTRRYLFPYSRSLATLVPTFAARVRALQAELGLTDADLRQFMTWRLEQVQVPFHLFTVEEVVRIILLTADGDEPSVSRLYSKAKVRLDRLLDEVERSGNDDFFLRL